MPMENESGKNNGLKGGGEGSKTNRMNINASETLDWVTGYYRA